EPNAEGRKDGGAAEPRHLPHGRRLRVPDRRDARHRRRRLPRHLLRRLLPAARPDERRRLGAHARADQGAERQGPRRQDRVMSTQPAAKPSTEAKPAPKPRPAATIILLRQARTVREGIEVLMLKRTQNAAFLGGAYVFPGGSLDAADADPRVLARVPGLSAGEADARLGIPGALAYYVAAVRECFEEAAILLLRDERGNPLDPDRAARLARHRNDPFLEFIERENLFIPAGELAYYGHWITAPG